MLFFQVWCCLLKLTGFFLFKVFFYRIVLSKLLKDFLLRAQCRILRADLLLCHSLKGRRVDDAAFHFLNAWLLFVLAEVFGLVVVLDTSLLDPYFWRLVGCQIVRELQRRIPQTKLLHHLIFGRGGSFWHDVCLSSAKFLVGYRNSAFEGLIRLHLKSFLLSEAHVVCNRGVRRGVFSEALRYFLFPFSLGRGLLDLDPERRINQTIDEWLLST